MSLAAVFDYVCARDPERTLVVGGERLIVCQRCLGIYAGALGGLIMAWWVGPPVTRRGWIVHGLLIAQLVPLGLLGLPTGLWMRYASGALFGFSVARMAGPSKAMDSARRPSAFAVGLAFAIACMLAPPALSRWTHAPPPIFTGIVVLGAAAWIVLTLAAIRSCAACARTSRT